MLPTFMNYKLNDVLERANACLPKGRPLIAISGNCNEQGLALAPGYYERLVAAGAAVVVVPPTADLTQIADLLTRVDGVLLSGGADINPLWLDEEPLPQLGNVNPLRDAQELLLIRLAEQRQIPILGICRGMQLLAAAFGGKLYQDIATQHSAPSQQTLLRHSQQAPRSEAAHSISICQDSILYRLFGERCVVNSFHHQAVADCGAHFRPVAFSPDGVIEAMESSEYKSIMGVQWHPECQEGAAMERLFEWFVGEAESYQRARKWHERYLTLDSHCDTPMFFDQDIDFNRRDPKILVDICKMHEGGLDASIMVAYLAQGERTAQAHQDAREKTDRLLHQLREMIEACPQAALAKTPEELRSHKQRGVKSVMMGIENGYPFGQDLSLIAYYRKMGVVYTTLCHNGNNDICDSARPSKKDLQTHPQTQGAEHGGLSDFGKAAVREMNRLGMMIDLSHAAESSFYDALRHSTQPIVCSHSSARALCDHPRNLTDQQLRDLAAAGGVAQCTFYQGFLRQPDAEAANVLDAVAHIKHMVAVAGIDHVGIGTDFDGDGGVPGLANASELINLTRRLMAEGFSDEELAKLWGGNFLRVMEQVQAAAQA